jgi:hypothetical protein
LAKTEDAAERRDGALTGDQVAQYLRRNPGFLLQYPEIAAVWTEGKNRGRIRQPRSAKRSRS